MISDILKVLDGETFDDYRFRIYQAKQLGAIDYTWAQIADLFGELFGVFKDESRWRKEAKHRLSQEVEAITNNANDNIQPSVEDAKQDLLDILTEMKKERVKISDERTQNNAYIRRIAREESIVEIAKYVADQMTVKPLIPNIVEQQHFDFEQEGIVQLSDWHYGIDINNYVNTFNPDVCVKRVRQLLNEAKWYFTHNPVSKIYVVNLGDLIAGRIHSTIRLQSRYDVITQCLKTSEILAEFLNEISEIAPVEYYDCFDNHSRLEPIKTESLDLETLCRITPWYLKERFKDVTRIEIKDNFIDDDIISFKVLNGKYTIGAVHGHKDKPTKVIDNLCMMTKINFDAILTSHLHHFNADEQSQVVLISNGSLMGTDKYAFDLRLSSKPSQNLLLVNNKSVIDDIHRVVLS